MSLAQRRRRVSLRPYLNGKNSLTGRDTFAFTLNRALGKINGFTTSAAGVSPIKFIRKNLFFFTALGTFAGDYFEIFKICIAGTMLGS